MAEEKTATLLRQKAIEDKKMRELEKIREQLETCLDEERQAKKDEEIVRQLQARVLEEEWGRREALEKLQEEQRMMLEEERRKREAFEQQQSEKESQLRGNLIHFSLTLRISGSGSEKSEAKLKRFERLITLFWLFSM